MLKDTLLAVAVVTVAFFNTIDVELLLADGDPFASGSE